MKIINPVNLDKINDVLHDCYFDVEAIKIENNVFEVPVFQNKAESLIKKRFFIFKQFEIQSYTSILKIYNVNSYRIVDTEKIGYYCFNKLIFNPVKKNFSILADVPISINVNVKLFEVSLTSSKDNIQCKRRWYIWKPVGLFIQHPKERLIN